MSDYWNKAQSIGGYGIGAQANAQNRSAVQEEYMTQQDVQYLVQAEEIKRDKKRLERARAYLRSKMADLTTVANDIGALDT